MGKILDLTGQKFGRLTVVSFNKRENKKTYWNCICDCGRETVTQGSSLTSGNTTSCGCFQKERTHEIHFKDLTGQKFSKLTVINFNRRENQITYWNCICDCGTIVVIRGGSLVSGRSKSCGCLQKERIHETCFKDLTSKKFGRLTVVSFNRRENKRTLWNCICDCGTKTVVKRENLISENSQSCGCYQKENISGENSRFWKGGISFEPYCPKFNEDLRKRVRSFFNNECIICGRKKEDNNNKNLSVHHVSYDKMICCNNKPVLFAALCQSCHIKTNFDREKWEAILYRIINEIYNGKSCYTKEEYKKIER